MGNVLISEVTLKDMVLKFIKDEEKETVGFYILPEALKDKDVSDEKLCRINSLAQVKLLGDKYPGGYGNGQTMRNSDTAYAFKYDSQSVSKEMDDIFGEYTLVSTKMVDGRGHVMINEIKHFKDEESFEMTNTFVNEANEKATLEMLSSFEMGNLTPFIKGDAPDSMVLHRLRAKWSHEGRLCSDTIEDMQLEPSWSTWSVAVERFGHRGSMPVCQFFPFVAIEDKINGALWGAQLAIESSWQMEVYRQDDGLHIGGGIADREFGHWMKDVNPGESFTSPKAIISTCVGDIDTICYRLTKAGDKFVNNGPKSEQDLPVLFNEYCTTWGNPSEENITGILKAIEGHGLDYFVIDCGWFKEDGIRWDISMGDYVPSHTLFPEGIKHTVDLIKSYNLKAGIWFEIDNIGEAAKAYTAHTDHMLKHDGMPVATSSRRFWDMRDPWTVDYLTERVIKTLKDAGLEYMKMDYNDNIGIGCDGAESLGEGLRQNMEASVEFVRKVKREVPGIILENCSSGGHKLEPLMMSECAMASFSDAHETPEIPLVAANLHRAILPRQSQIWSVIRKDDSLKRIGYSIANTFLGRMCLSGDVTELSEAQWDVIDRGIAFYKQASYIIKDGFSHRLGPKLTSERHLKAWQAVLRVAPNNDALLVLHCFNGDYPQEIEIDVTDINTDKIDVYSYDDKADVKVVDGKLIYKTTEDMCAIGVHLHK